MTDEEIIKRCEAAGMRWMPPPTFEGRTFDGCFDTCSVDDIRALLELSAPSVADAAGASAIAALRSARHAIYMARNVNEAFDAVEALIVEAIAKESGND